MALIVSHAGLAILVVLGRGISDPHAACRRLRSSAPPVASGRAQRFVYFFALVPLVGDGAVRAVHAAGRRISSAAPLVVLSGLAVIVAAGDRIRIEHQYVIGYVWAALLVLPPVLVALAMVIQPWTLAIDLRVGRPADEMGQFFADSFQRRTGQPLAIVAGDPATASLVALMAPSRPSLYLEVGAGISAARDAGRTSRRRARSWCGRRTDTTGRPPPDILRQFPDLVAEVPRASSAASRAACRCCASAGA